MSKEANNELDSAYSKVESIVSHNQSVKKALDELGKGLTWRILRENLLKGSRWYISSCNSKVIYGKRDVVPELTRFADLMDTIENYNQHEFRFMISGLKMILKYESYNRDKPFCFLFDYREDSQEIVSVIKGLGIKLDTRALTLQVKKTEERLERERAFRDAFKV